MLCQRMKKFRELIFLKSIGLGLVDSQRRLCHGSCDNCIVRFKCYTEPINGAIMVGRDEFVRCGDANEGIYYR